MTQQIGDPVSCLHFGCVNQCRLPFTGPFQVAFLTTVRPPWNLVSCHVTLGHLTDHIIITLVEVQGAL